MSGIRDQVSGGELDDSIILADESNCWWKWTYWLSAAIVHIFEMTARALLPNEAAGDVK